MTARVFFDTDVLMDVLAERELFYRESVVLWSMAEEGEICGVVSAISFNNINYVLGKLRDRKTARSVLPLIRDVFEVVPLDGRILNQAIDADFKDFEDAIQYFSAVAAKADCLVTRNLDHFQDSAISVHTPGEFLTLRDG